MTSQAAIPPLPQWFETRPLESGSGESGRFIFSNLVRGFVELTIEIKSFDGLAGNYNRYTADGSNDDRAAAGLQVLSDWLSNRRKGGRGPCLPCPWRRTRIRPSVHHQERTTIDGNPSRQPRRRLLTRLRHLLHAVVPVQWERGLLFRELPEIQALVATWRLAPVHSEHCLAWSYLPKLPDPSLQIGRDFLDHQPAP